MNNQILAIVNGKNITRDDLERFMIQLGENAARYANPEGEKILIGELVHQELFLSEALQNKMDEEQAFQDQMAFEKLQMLKQYAVKKCLSEAVVDEAELLAHYEAHKEEFEKPDRVKASHILVDSEAKALVILEEIATGVTFEEAASAHSSCPSKERGGDLGYFGRGQMVPEFEMAAFEMQIGEISKPVQTQFGYHLIKLSEKEEAGFFDLDEISFDLMKDLTMKKQSELYTSKVEVLKGQFTVEIL